MSVKSCSKCLVSFECTNETSGCWCEQLVIPPMVLAHLKETYANCLCPQCLKEFSKLNYDSKNNCGLTEFSYFCEH
jgi:hypothetical protein